jgi:hypothetical protein
MIEEPNKQGQKIKFPAEERPGPLRQGNFSVAEGAGERPR